jgi:hypothetical protein
MKTDGLLNEFIAFVTPKFAPNRVSATEPRQKGNEKGNEQGNQPLRITVTSADEKLPKYDPKILKELSGTAEGTKDGSIIRGTYKNAKYEITLTAKRNRQLQPV